MAAPATRPAFPCTDAGLGRSRETQQLAYDCAERVARWIEPGVTERQATAKLLIGHQVTRTAGRGPAGVTLFGFGVRTLQTLGRELVGERLHGRSPLRADGRASRHAPTPGLWAVEPHIGLREVGVTFEELLVVTEDDAYRLDDDLPHVRRWSSAEEASR